MVKFKINFKFNKSLLNKLVASSSSGVTLQRIKHHLALHPVHLNDLNKSVKDILSLGIAKYNKDLDGLLLGYQNIKLAKDGIINNDSCYIHMNLEADFFCV
ncbi:hypothetical protein NQ317_002563 [Molorchus minor]|uniref:Uncharacterized protein n=1 Tax=Molorchus minor TaxID=1323400 RepID=A0ABQ9ISS4_9CUCU|nr:hypothetical protein NQ317_002563 [Molorchus minor]